MAVAVAGADLPPVDAAGLHCGVALVYQLITLVDAICLRPTRPNSIAAG